MKVETAFYIVMLVAMIQRQLREYCLKMAAVYPVLTITGPRQSGKTTLVRRTFPDKPYVNLEAPDRREYAMRDPRGFLATLPDGAIIDEVQHVPQLCSYIQEIVDADNRNGLYILTGSHQPLLQQSISQSLAGRTALLTLLPFSLEEMSALPARYTSDEYMTNGFYPRIYDQGIPAVQSHADYIGTYIERDIRSLMQLRNISLFQRFLALCAGRCGQLLNLKSLADDSGISHTTAREWMSLLEACYVIYLLKPWHVNIGKRLVKSPKLYFYDVGIASYLLGIHTSQHIVQHPLRGHLFENMVVMDVYKHICHHARHNKIYFYRDSNNNEVDLIIEDGPQYIPIEIKSAQTINGSFFKGLHVFKKLSQVPTAHASIVYDGALCELQGDVFIYGLKDVPKLLARVCGAG